METLRGTNSDDPRDNLFENEENDYIKDNTDDDITEGGTKNKTVNNITKKEIVNRHREANRDFLLSGVTHIYGGNNPRKMLTYTDRSYGIIDYPNRVAPLVAAGAFGSGRTISLADKTMLDFDRWSGEGDTERFYLNSLQWLARTASYEITIVTYSDNIAGWLVNTLGFNNVIVIERTDSLAVALENANIFIGWLDSCEPANNIEALKTFARGGGGLLIADHGEEYDTLSRSESPTNKLLRDVGIGFTRGLFGESNLVSVSYRSTSQVTVHEIIELLNDYSNVSPTEFAQKIDLISEILEILPKQDSLRNKLELAFQNRLNTINPTPDNQITDFFEKVLLIEEMNIIGKLPVSEVTAHRTARDVFGDIPDRLTRVSKNITLDTSKSRWHSTGLYAVPGDIVTICVPESIVNKGYQIIVNSNRDKIDHHDSWSRVPFGTSRTFNIDSTTIEVANAFGGAIYLDFRSKPAYLGEIKIEIKNALLAPIFILGKTSDAEWIESIRHYPAPRAELISDGMTLSVPSDAIRNLSNPTDLMTSWNKAVNAMDYVAGFDDLRTYSERINLDVQISTVTLHSGYPIQGHVTQAVNLVNYDRLVTEGERSTFHEVGHNLQKGYFSFNLDEEISCHVFADIALEALVTTPQQIGTDAKTNCQTTLNTERKINEEAIIAIDTWQLEVTPEAIDTVNVLDLFSGMPLLKDNHSLDRLQETIVISVWNRSFTLDGTSTDTPRFILIITNNIERTDTHTLSLVTTLQQMIGKIRQTKGSFFKVEITSIYFIHDRYNFNKVSYFILIPQFCSSLSTLVSFLSQFIIKKILDLSRNCLRSTKTAIVNCLNDRLVVRKTTVYKALEIKYYADYLSYRFLNY